MTAPTQPLAQLLPALRACRVCEPHLPLGARPLFQLDARARILIASQAPGRIAHEKGRTFDDVSGDRLRQWLGVTREQFYDPACFAILPMGLCFPGSGRGGDLPPRPECAPLWRQRVLAALPGICLTLAIGHYALAWHLQRKASVDALVSGWREGLAQGLLPLPHPSPRNQRWLRERPWFEAELLPALRDAVGRALACTGLWPNAETGGGIHDADQGAAMERVTGMGGVFFKSADPQALGAWYREHLGLDVAAWGGAVFRWGQAQQPEGMTLWCPLAADTDKMAPSAAPFMINFRVADLDALLAALRAEGCQVLPQTQDSAFGKFGWVIDPEGNKVELWQPPAGA